MTEQEIWGTKPHFRLFISHVSTYKKEAEQLKEKLADWGISGFVAHTDIEPSHEWQTVIETALRSAHGLLAILTEDFHDSKWTDQEIGFALGRDIQVIPLIINKDPYGFIGKIQGLRCDLKTEAIKIPAILIRNSEKMVDAFLHLVEHSSNYHTSNQLSILLARIEKLNDSQVSSLIKIYHTNSQVKGSVGFFGGEHEKKQYQGLAKELLRITGKDFSSELNTE